MLVISFVMLLTINLLQRWSAAGWLRDRMQRAERTRAMAQDLTSTGRDLRLRRPATADPALVRALVIGAALLFLGLFLCCRWWRSFTEALRKGVAAYLAAITDPEARSRDPSDAADRGDRGAAQPRVRARRGVGDRASSSFAARTC